MTLVLIDHGAAFWTAYYGTGGSAVDAYSLTIDRIQFYAREYPRTVLCCDHPKLKRKEWHEGYKSNRKPKPEDAIDALVSVAERVKAWGVPVVQCEGYEADDVIATLVAQAWPEDVRIIGSEKDFFCLLCDTVRLVGKAGFITANDCITKFGVAPSQMSDWLALVGDAADAIPGCPGCGPGRATALLERFGTIEGIRAATDEEILSVAGVGKKTLAGLREWDPTLARKLVKLLADAPINLSNLFKTEK